MKLTVKSKFFDYSVTTSSLPQLKSSILNDEESFYIIDSEIIRIYSSEVNFHVLHKFISFQAKEQNKTINYTEKIISELLSLGIKRNSKLICIGGGITQDVCGFIASILFRGIPWHFYPTTLLSQADSCVGGKTSLNVKRLKNLIGTFNPPQMIYIIPEFILTLKSKDYFSGIGEIVKMHVIGGEDYMNRIITNQAAIYKRDLQILQDLIHNSLSIKTEYIENDEFDQNKRVILNFGHTFGHALESMANYQIPHGQAIIYGMIFSNIISVNRKKINKSTFDFINYKLFFPNIMAQYDFSKLTTEKLLSCIKVDKKQTNERITMVLLSEENSLTTEKDISENEIKLALNDFQSLVTSNFAKLNEHGGLDD